MVFDIEKIKSFPEKPGVYLMKNAQKKVLYIGKANNLRARVRQYFVAGQDGRAMIPHLMRQVNSVETIVVTSEKEALLLENNLIKEHKPKYNALLKDDKSYIALKINIKHKWPRLELARYRGQVKADSLYFGPYTSAYAARQTFDLLQKIFPMRQCSDQELKRRERPCILYDMKRCVAPCVNRCTKEEYDEYVKGAIKFLKGQDNEVLKKLKKEMNLASDTLDFERAEKIYKTIKQIEKTVEGQLVEKALGDDIDVLGVFREAEEIMVSQLIYRGGRLIGSKEFSFSGILEENQELFESFILQHYQNRDQLPSEILVPVKLEKESILSEILGKTLVKCPQKGEKKALVNMALENAESSYRRGKDKEAILETTLAEMEEKFHLTRFPERIECFDNSHTSGSGTVSALVAFTDGKKDSSRYRKYKIRSTDNSDDYAAMREALLRRFKKGAEENDLPDLLLIDGGKGHLNVALSVLNELNIISVDVIGVAKEEGRHDKGGTLEQIFLPNIKDPIILPKNSRVLFLLQQIRDEAHRFVITFHRKERSKKMLKSALDDIPGIGPVKKRALLKKFGSVKGIKNATREELKAVKGISDKDILALRLSKKS